jgi:hypothetical protein
MPVATSSKRPVGRARWDEARRARPSHQIPAWALLSTALSHENRIQSGRPDVDAAVQLAAEIALSKRRKFRYNRD